MKVTLLELPALLSLALLFPGQVDAQKDDLKSSVPDRYRSVSVTQNTTNRTLVNIGQVAMWIYSSGRSAVTPEGNSGFFFPRGSTPETAAIYEDGPIWGGKVNDGSQPVIRVGGGTYSEGTVPGAILSAGVGEEKTDPINVDRVWRIRHDFATADLTQDAAEFNRISAAEVTQAQKQQLRDIYREDWIDWPAHKGAPFYDADSNGVYEPQFNADGTPRLAPRFGEEFDPSVHADEPGLANADMVVYLIANDLDQAAVQTLYGSPSIGLEVQTTLWAYASSHELGRAIFKRFRLLYKGHATSPLTAVIDSMYIAQWSDPDVGGAGDDFVGLDTLLSLGYAYNSSSVDPVYSAAGLPPPASGYDFLSGPIVVGDPHDVAVFDLKKRGGFRNLPMASFSLSFSGDPTTDPSRGGDYNGTLQWWNLLRGFQPRPEHPPQPWIDPTTGLPVKFMVPGDPVTGTGWLDSSPGDRRMQLISGPFTMAVGDTQETVVAALTGLGSDRLSSISVLKFTDRFVQELYDDLTRGAVRPPILALQATGLDRKVVLKWPDIRADIDNSRGYEFEGYNVYQGESAVGPWHRVATFDIINNVSIIFDEQFDPESGLVLNLPVQFGSDSGIQHFVEIREDATDDNGLENGREYYFAVTSYLYNPDSEPNALESTFQAVSVTPIGPVIGTDYSDVTADRLAEHVSGASDGRVLVTVIDPAQVTGHNYQVSFSKDANTGETLWSLIDLDLGQTILDNQYQTNDSLDISGSVADGLLVRVLTPPQGFKSFEVVANAAGPLDPPEGGAADYQGFPSLRPTERQQVGSGVWLFHTGDNGGPSGGGTLGSYSAFLSRSLRNDNFDRVVPFDWEMRFTSNGSWAVRTFEDKLLLKVPFELWNIGNSTIDDTSDDYRCIPYFLSHGGLGQVQTDPNGLTYQLDPNDHSASGGSNDPYTAWVYWYIPPDNSPGEGGYNAYLTAVDTVAGNAGNYGFDGTEAFARTVLISWNGDDVSDGEVAAGTQMTPEHGTIFRIISNKPNQENDVFSFSTNAFMQFDIAKGDINDDGSVDVADVTSLIDFILRVSEPTGEQKYAADFNNDLDVNVADVVAIINDILGITQPGEAAVVAGTVDLSVPLQVPVVDAVMTVPVRVRSEVLINGLQVTLGYDPSQLAPLEPVSSSGGVRVFHHAQNGKVTYVLTDLESKALSLSSIPEFRFEVLASAKSTEAEVSIEKVAVAGKYGQLHTTKIGNSVASTNFVPETFALYQNFPNPFNPETMLRFDLPIDSKVTVEVFNILGQRVRQLLDDGDLPAGQHNVRWDGRNDAGRLLASGVYVVRMRAAEFVSSRKIMLLK